MVLDPSRGCVRRGSSHRSALIVYFKCGHGVITLARSEIDENLQEIQHAPLEFDPKQTSLEEVRETAKLWLRGQDPREFAAEKCADCRHPWLA